jgi:hypothetical protein
MTAEAKAQATTHHSSSKTSPPSEKAYENFNPAAVRESSNGLPWSPSNTSRGDTENITWSKALMTVKIDDFKHVHKKPCVRDALLVGIGVGFGAGGIRASLGGWSIFEVYRSTTDFHSTDPESLQLGCGQLLLWLMDNVRVLSKKEAFRNPGFNQGCRCY